jgi:predicted DNA binding protein
MVTIETPDFEALDRALAADSSIENPQILQESGTQRLYKVEPDLTPAESHLRTKIAELGGVMQQGTGSAAGWVVTIDFPNRAAVNEYYEFCIDQGYSMEILELQEEAGPSTTALTGRQRAVLISALDAGYFEIPREASLEDLADELDISPNAASERLRRGVRNLVETAFEGEQEPETIGLPGR